MRVEKGLCGFGDVRCYLAIGYCSLVLALSGCQKENRNPNMVPVNAKVTYKAEPVEGATVVFYNAKNFAKGITDSSGIAAMNTNTLDDGVFVGDYQVSVDKQELVIPAGTTSREQVTTVWHVPAKYADFNKSELRATVSLESENIVNLELKD